MRSHPEYSQACKASWNVALAYGAEWVARLTHGLRKGDQDQIRVGLSLAAETDQKLCELSARQKTILSSALSSSDGRWICIRLGHKLPNVSVEGVTLLSLPDIVAEIAAKNAKARGKLLRCVNSIESRQRLTGASPSPTDLAHEIKELAKVVREVLHNAARKEDHLEVISSELRNVIKESKDRLSNQVVHDGFNGRLATNSTPYPTYPNEVKGNYREALFRPDTEGLGKIPAPGSRTPLQQVRAWTTMRNQGASSAATAQDELRHCLPPQPVVTLGTEFLEVFLPLVEQSRPAGMKDLLRNYIEEALRRHLWIDREALVKGVKRAYGEKYGASCTISLETLNEEAHHPSGKARKREPASAASNPTPETDIEDLRDKVIEILLAIKYADLLRKAVSGATPWEAMNKKQLQEIREELRESKWFEAACTASLEINDRELLKEAYCTGVFRKVHGAICAELLREQFAAKT